MGDSRGRSARRDNNRSEGDETHTHMTKGRSVHVQHNLGTNWGIGYPENQGLGGGSVTLLYLV